MTRVTLQVQTSVSIQILLLLFLETLSWVIDFMFAFALLMVLLEEVGLCSGSWMCCYRGDVRLESLDHRNFFSNDGYLRRVEQR